MVLENGDKRGKQAADVNGVPREEIAAKGTLCSEWKVGGDGSSALNEASKILSGRKKYHSRRQIRKQKGSSQRCLVPLNQNNIKLDHDIPLAPFSHHRS